MQAESGRVLGSSFASGLAGGGSNHKHFSPVVLVMKASPLLGEDSLLIFVPCFSVQKTLKVVNIFKKKNNNNSSGSNHNNNSLKLQFKQQ